MQPLLHKKFPDFLQHVWDPDRMKIAEASPEKEQMRVGIMCKQEQLCTPYRVTIPKAGEATKDSGQDHMSLAKKSAEKPPDWLIEPKSLKSWC